MPDHPAPPPHLRTLHLSGRPLERQLRILPGWATTLPTLSSRDLLALSGVNAMQKWRHDIGNKRSATAVTSELRQYMLAVRLSPLKNASTDRIPGLPF
jgi:hypothetical protein